MLDPAVSLPVALTIGAVVLIGVAIVLMVIAGGEVRMARRLASAPQIRVAEVLRLGSANPPDRPRNRPLRVSGRVRCSQPVVTSDGDRLVVLHRTVEVELDGAGWRQIERVRESRRFQLWDHAGEISIDPAGAAEPIVSIPGVWRGSADELPAEYQPAIRRLKSTHGRPVRAARSQTRSVTVIDRVVVLAVPQIDSAGTVSLAPPRGGYVISTLEFDQAMRLLVGRRTPLVAGALVAGALGLICAISAAATAAVAAVSAR